MSAPNVIQLRRLASTIRLIRGYRFLDRCGEALIRLEEVLEKGWIPGDAAPTGGSMRNDDLGMVVQFSSEAVTVQQDDSVSFDAFLDQACKIFDVVKSSFGIETINAPSLQAIYQRGFDQSEEADAFIHSLGLWEPKPRLVAIMEGRPSAVTFTLCTTCDVVWHDIPVEQRRRVQASSVLQARQPPFDPRLVGRIKLLPSKQKEAMQALMRLRRNMPEIKPAAAQFDLENALETEFDARTFDLPDFYQQSWLWIERMAGSISEFAPQGSRK